MKRPATLDKGRGILAVGARRDVMEGAGEIVGRVLPQGRLGLEPLDPFLMLDHFKMQPGGPGFPEHPHRGFEILTYVRQGWASHHDSMGNQARVGAGGLMRLTAGSGMVHGEGGGAEKGQVVEGLQFWVNLERTRKGMKPSFQHVEDSDLPRLMQDDGRVLVKVLVGPGSPVKIVTPMVYLEVTLKPSGHFMWDLDPAHQGFVYALEGSILAGEAQTEIQEAHIGVLGQGHGLDVVNHGKTDAVFILAAGQPHKQPVVWNGPYVD